MQSCFNSSGLNALHLATINGDIEMIHLVLRHGVDINSKSSSNKTALHYACESGNLNLVKYLLKNGSDINIQDDFMNTPMHVSIEKNFVEIVKYLLNNEHIDLNLCNSLNMSCLSLATSLNKQEVVNIIQETLKLNSKTEQKNIDTDLAENLAQFYKKKSFARPINKSTKQSASNLLAKNFSFPICSNQTMNKITHTKEKCNKKDLSLLEDDSYISQSTDEEDKETNKKKRLSMSPSNQIDETLNWMKRQSSSDLSKFELSLTEAGKLTLEYLNRNDPCQDENRLLMKLINDFEKQEEENKKFTNKNDNSLFFSCLKQENLDDDILFF